MKRLFLSTIFIATAFLSLAQTISVTVSEYQLSVFQDTVFSQTEFIPFKAAYIFDIDNNTITSIIDGNVVTMSVFTSELIDQDGVRTIYFTYNDFPHFTWSLDLAKREITYREGFVTEDRLYTFVSKF